MTTPSNSVSTANNEVNVQTAAPDWMLTYLSQLADVHYGRHLNKMYQRMLEGFLAHEPWKAFPPLEWRAAKSVTPIPADSRPSPTDWVAANLLLPKPLFERVEAAIEKINTSGLGLQNRDLSRRTFLYTALYWWVAYVYPYKGVRILPQQV